MANLFNDYKFHSYSASWLGLTLDYSKSRSGTTQNYSFSGNISVHPPSGGSTSFGYTITVTIYCDSNYSTGQILSWNPGSGISSVKRKDFSGSVAVPNKTSGTTSFYVAIHLSNGYDYSPGGTLPIDDYAYWNDINAYQPDGSTQNGLIFDLTTSDGGSWTNITNEPTPASAFTKVPGTTATISNVRSNIAGAHYTTNSVTNDGSTTFTWTFSQANYVVHMYTAWDTYAITYNANGGTQSTCPSTHYKTYNVTASIANQIPSRPAIQTTSYTITFDPGEGTASYTTYAVKDTTTYDFDGWNTKADGTGSGYAPGANYTVNAALGLYAQWDWTLTKGGVVFPSATRAGYDLVGWTRDPNNISLVESGYIPTQNETLYAVWSVIHKYINTRSNNGWKTPTVKVKDSSEWKEVLDGVWTPQTVTLPSTYTELSYITCTGTQYINPSYTQVASTDIEVTFLTTTDPNIIGTSGGVCLIGNNVSSGDGGIRFFKAYDSTYIYTGFGATRAADTTHTIQKNIKYTAKINSSGATVSGATVASASGSTYYAIRLFNDAVNTGLNFNGRIYGVKIRNGATLVRNLVPCMRNSDSVLGMYDTVNGVFYTNAGSGTFGAGPKKTGWGNGDINNTYSWFFVGGTEYPSKEDWTWRQWLNSSYNTDMWEPVEIDGVYYIGIEPDVGGYFCITNESGSSEANLLNKPIKNDFSYTIGKK